MRSIRERVGGTDELLRTQSDKTKNDIRVAVPGIVQSFDPTEQTVVVQPAVRERIRDEKGNVSFVNIPLLLDVPVVFPRAGGFVLTMPVHPGNECLVVFGDMCIDAWWSNGGIQNQIEKRRHDLSDAFAIMGTWSQPRVISNYSTDSAQLRTDDGNTCVGLKPGEIDLAINQFIMTVKPGEIDVNSNITINVNGSANIQGNQVNIAGADGVSIQGRERSESW